MSESIYKTLQQRKSRYEIIITDAKAPTKAVYINFDFVYFYCKIQNRDR